MVWHLCLTLKLDLVQVLIHPGIDLFLSKSLGRWIWLTLKIWPSAREVVWWPTNDVSCPTGHTGSRGKVKKTEIKGNSRSIFKPFNKWCILFCKTEKWFILLKLRERKKNPLEHASIQFKFYQSLNFEIVQRKMFWNVW